MARLGFLQVGLAVIASCQFCFAGDTNDSASVDSIAANELKRKALAYLQKQYPRIEPDRFKSLNGEFHLPPNLSRDTVLPFTFADKASIKRWGFKDGEDKILVESYKDRYTVRIQLDGRVVGVDEEHLSDKQIKSLMLPASSSDRILTLPKAAVANYWP